MIIIHDCGCESSDVQKDVNRGWYFVREQDDKDSFWIKVCKTHRYYGDARENDGFNDGICK